MNSRTVSDLLLIIYVLVDDWCQANATDLRKGQPGKQPELSDSEVTTLMLAMDYITWWIKANSIVEPDLLFLCWSNFVRHGSFVSG